MGKPQDDNLEVPNPTPSTPPEGAEVVSSGWTTVNDTYTARRLTELLAEASPSGQPSVPVYIRMGSSVHRVKDVRFVEGLVYLVAEEIGAPWTFGS